MIKRAIALGAAALALAGCDALPGGEAPPALDIPEVEAGDLSEDTMKDVTRILSSDEFEGRMPGSKGEELTVALLTDEVRRGTIACPHGWGHAAGWSVANAAGGANTNELASARIEDVEFLAGMARLNGIPVRLEAAVGAVG